MSWNSSAAVEEEVLDGKMASPMASVSELEPLFDRFKSELRYRRIFRDGAVDVDGYCAAPMRAVFVLKEVNEPHADREWDLREYVRDGARGQTWDNVARWTLTILHGATWTDSQTIDDQTRRQTLRSIAVVNLNKEGAGAATHRPSLQLAARKARHLLARQIEILDPHVVGCCGSNTGDLAGEILYGLAPKDWERVYQGVWIAPTRIGKTAITMPHPQARRSARDMHEGLRGALARLDGEMKARPNRVG